VTVTGMTAEIAVLGIALGLVFSLVCYLATNLSPCGMVTPGWLAVTLVEDAAQVGVIAVVVVLTWAGTAGLQRVVILFGKRLFAAVVMLAVLLQMTLALVTGDGYSAAVTHETLGFIVPGLVAYQLVRQPGVPTVIATVSVTAIAYTVLVVGILLRLLPL
jgi:gamma-polyglutamate biosynthesis protein CapC